MHNTEVRIHMVACKATCLNSHFNLSKITLPLSTINSKLLNTLLVLGNPQTPYLEWLSRNLGDIIHYAWRYWFHYPCWFSAQTGWKYHAYSLSNGLLNTGTGNDDVAIEPIKDKQYKLIILRNAGIGELDTEQITSLHKCHLSQIDSICIEKQWKYKEQVHGLCETSFTHFFCLRRERE